MVGGLTLNEFDVPDANDVLWVFNEVDGWHDGAAVEVESQSRTVAHGQFAQQGRRGGRTITVSGSVVAPDRAQAGDAVDRISSLLAGGEFGRFDFHDADQGCRWANVQLAATPDVVWDRDVFVKFQLQFLAPDAYRYGQTSSASVGFAESSGSGAVFPAFPGGVMDFGPLPDFGLVSIQNPGSAPASPVFTVTGPTSGFVITDVRTGKRNTFIGPVGEDQTLTIDASDGSVLLQGVADRSGDFIVEAWPSIPARSLSKFLFEPLTGATPATLTASVVATYY